MKNTIIGYIAAPTEAGEHYARCANSWGFRGRKPRWYYDYASALKACRGIERAGWRDGGRGRDCYIVSVVRTERGVEVRAGGDGRTGLALSNGALTVGCSSHVADAVIWLRSRSARWMRSHGIGEPSVEGGDS